MSAIKRADEVAALGHVAEPSGGGAYASMLVERANALVDGYLAAQAILTALGVNPAMAAYAIEQGWTPATHCGEGDEETSIGRWTSPIIDGRYIFFTERPCEHGGSVLYYTDTPPTDDDGDGWPWGQFFIDDADGNTIGYPWEQRDAAIKHWKDGTDGR